jgi:uncharacterized protein (TIGR02265 family)
LRGPGTFLDDSAMPAASQVKGTILAARLAFVRERGGEELLERVLARLPEPDRKALRGMVLVTSTYPMAVNLRLDAAIAAELSPGDPDRVFVEMGRASAEVNLSGPQRLFVRRGDPHHLLGFTEAIYGYYYSVGRRSYQSTGPTSGTLVTQDAESVTPGDCLTVIGWHERAIEMSGGRGVRIQHPVCRARGGDRCEYRCSWDSAG